MAQVIRGVRGKNDLAAILAVIFATALRAHRQLLNDEASWENREVEHKLRVTLSAIGTAKGTTHLRRRLMATLRWHISEHQTCLCGALYSLNEELARSLTQSVHRAILIHNEICRVSRVVGREHHHDATLFLQRRRLRGREIPVTVGVSATGGVRLLVSPDLVQVAFGCKGCTCNRRCHLRGSWLLHAVTACFDVPCHPCKS